MRKRGNIAIAIATIAFAAVLAGCADPKAANEGNFANAINDYLGRGGRGNICFSALYFPHQVNAFDGSEQQAQLTEMADAGLVRKERKAVKVAQFFGPPTTQIQTVYDLTAAGKAHVAANQLYGGSQFCIAHMKVGKIVKFTEPNSAMGITVSEVTWVPAVASMEPWAERLLSAKKLQFAQRLIDQTTATERNQTLDLTNKGWEAQ